ncbi:DUF2806 domain-containing protein [Aquirufa antheringensis]|uniref:DUF2806 domain-containing protein n=1 Tax=Aquirufa antheringensis TaxID=2516559 RepID=UPI0022A85A41|nr:DUF2806 domain-containing protein [Aquirufa antheringensis]MCZ2478024.1 DUF2806 domain-containing protein [Aquirufa antheringensis]
MKLNDVLGLGKVFPIDKLIDIVSNSVGKISKPYFDKKEVDTKAYEIEKLAEARAKEMKIIAMAVKENFQLTGGIEYKEDKLSISSPKELPIDTLQTILINPPLEDRTQERLNFQEAKRQLNIENVTAFAAEELINEPTVTDEPLDEDWTTRFFKIAEEVSNEEMQALWGKILAGEIKQPKTYSLRTLELIRNLSKLEAKTFMKVANFAVKYENANFLFKTNDDNLLRNTYNINYRDIALLIEIGLIQPGDFVSYQILQQATDNQRVFTAGNVVIIAKVKANTPTIQMPVNVFTNAGNELIKLINSNPPFDYLTSVAKSIKNENVDVKYGHILAWEGNNIKHTQPLQEFI